MDLLMEAAVVEKLGPTSGPREKYFARFEAYFNGLKEEEKEEIRSGAGDQLTMIAAEDDVTREFCDATKTFFSSFTGAYQRGDYYEFARLVKVC